MDGFLQPPAKLARRSHYDSTIGRVLPDICMPQALEKIDAIARRVQRDALYLSFWKKPPDPEVELDSRRNSAATGWPCPESAWAAAIDWDNHHLRKKVMQWLNDEAIRHAPCYPRLDPGYLAFPYLGDLYLDVPNDPADLQYMKLIEHFELSDGTPKIDGVTWWVMPLACAMQFSDEDDPNFYEEL